MLILLGVSFSVFAQTKSDDKKLLLGEWTFETAVVNYPGHTTYFDIQNYYIDLYQEIKIDVNTLSFLYDEKIHTVKYEIEGNYLGFEISSEKTFIAEWAIVGDKLYMEKSIKDPSDQSKDVLVLITYKRK